MVKLILHLSDIHVRTNQYHDLYKRQFDIFLQDARIKTEDLSFEEIRFVITGDIFHSKINISNEQILLTSWFLIELSKIGKIVIIPGNHDFLVNNQERIDSITPIIELLNNSNIVYYKDSGVYEDENIKWIVYSLYQNNKRPEFENGKDHVFIGLFHGSITGMSTDLGYVFEDSYDKLNFAECDIVLCGDIHKRNIIYLNENKPTRKIPIIQIGSFLQQDFSETINHHGYGIYDVENDEYTFHDLPNDNPFMNFTINDIKDIEDGKEVLLNLG